MDNDTLLTIVQALNGQVREMRKRLDIISTDQKNLKECLIESSRHNSEMFDAHMELVDLYMSREHVVNMLRVIAKTLDDADTQRSDIVALLNEIAEVIDNYDPNDEDEDDDILDPNDPRYEMMRKLKAKLLLERSGDNYCRFITGLTGADIPSLGTDEAQVIKITKMIKMLKNIPMNNAKDLIDFRQKAMDELSI